jgi:hypothetical protein
MPRRFPIVLPIALCAIVLAGCHSNRPGPALRNSLDKAGLENAPTLGPAFRQFVIDYARADYKDAYAALNKASQGELARQLKSEISAHKDAIRQLKEDLHDVHHPNVPAKFDKREIMANKKRLDLLECCEDHPPKYLKYVDRPRPNPKDIATGIRNGTIMIAGEKIDGDRGILILNDRSGQSAGDTLLFVKEDEAWKLDYFRTSEGAAPKHEATPASEPEPGTEPEPMHHPTPKTEPEPEPSPEPGPPLATA